MRWALIIGLFLFFTLRILAGGRESELTPTKLSEALATLERTQIAYRGTVLLHGSDTIASCAWAGDGLLLLVHYCHPAGKYPARGFSFWSRELGVVELYEEQLAAGRVKRDYRQNEFPELVRTIFDLDFASLPLPAMRDISEKLYWRQNPACWATNLDWLSGKPSAACFATDIALYPAWAEDSLRVTSGGAWEKAFEAVKRKTPNE